ncbi:Ig-like domain-containing protein, partial [Patescibacteria group bacterium]|nr:Ig-like domain-containing protein [Patescibacteria group bacterium]
MWRRIKKISHLWKSKRLQIASIAVIFLGLVIGVYGSVSLPYVEGTDSADTVYKVSFNAPLTIHFSQIMNKSSVENNFQILPRLSGDFIWVDSRTLEYQPEKKLNIGDSYRVIIESDAKSFIGKSLGVDTVLYFEVTGPPFVQFVSPYYETEAPIVSQDQIITVMFDRAMEWGDIDTNDLLKIEPEVKGDFRILGLSTFQFIPKELPLSTNFVLTIPTGLKARDGGETEQIMAWEIETASPKVVESSPQNLSYDASINSPIALKFNQPVDLENVKPGINALLYPSNDVDADVNQKDDGFFNTEVTYGVDESGNTDKRILVFEPTFPYLYDTEYRFVMTSGLLPEKGDLGSKDDFELIFTTSSQMRIENTTYPTSDNESIVITFNTPVNAEDVLMSVSILPGVGDPTVTMVDDNYKAEISYNFLPNTRYTFTIDENFKDSAGNVLGEKFEGNFVTPPPQSKLSWSTEKLWEVFMKGVDPELIINHENVSEVYLEACQVTESNFFKNNTNQTWDNYRCYGTPIPIKISENSQSTLLNLSAITKRDWESGIYYVSLTGENNSRIYKLFFVSDTTLVIKKSENSLLVWATDMVTGESVSRMELSVNNFEGDEVARGVTDGDGVYKITKELGEGLFVIGKKTIEDENRWVIASEYWPLYAQDALGSDNDSLGAKVYLTSDKNTLSAGDELNVKGILRFNNDSLLTLPENKYVTVKLVNDSGDIVFESTVALRRNGSFDISFSLPKNLYAGSYKLEAQESSGEILPSNNKYVYITDESTPVDVELMNPIYDYVDNDIKIINLKASYGVGIPAASLRGEWKLYKKPYHFSKNDDVAYYSFSDLSNILCSKNGCPEYEEFVHQGEFRFDQNGEAEVVLTNFDGSNLESGYAYRIITNVENIDGRKILKSYDFKVHPGNFYIGLSAKHYLISQDEDIESSIFIANSTETKKVKMSLIQTLDGDEGKNWYSKSYDVGPDSIQASIIVPRKAPNGSYKLKVESSDSKGNEVVSEVPIYVIGEDYSSSGLSLIFDQVEYFVGGKAYGYVNAPNVDGENPALALLTYERGNTIGYQVLELNNQLTSFEIPVADSMVPNMHVKATVIKSANDIDSFLATQEQRRLESEQSQNEVELMLMEEELQIILANNEADEERISELEEKIKDLRGESEEDKKTLALSDENAFVSSLQPDIEVVSTNILVCNPEYEINIDLSISPENPQPGEEITASVYAYDYQNRPVSSVITLNIMESESYGKGNLLYNFFYKPKSSSVSTSSNISLPEGEYFSSSTYLPDAEFSFFEDTVTSSAYFNPVTLTDEGGKVDVIFTLPNKHVTWKLSALATSEAKQFGANSMDIPVSKRLSIKPITSAFVIPGDKTIIGAEIQNLSDEDIESRIELLVDDVEVKGLNKKNISLRPGEVTTTSWNVEIG